MARARTSAAEVVSIASERQQAHRLAQQEEAPRIAPARVGQHREHELARGLLLVLDLEGAAVAVGAAEDPAVVEADQEALEEDLLPGVEVRVRAHEARRLERHQHVGDRVAVGAQRARLRVPVAVLDAQALAAAAGARRAHAAVVAEPADHLEGPALGRLEAADPALQLLGRRQRGLRGARRGREHQSCDGEQRNEPSMHHRSEHGVGGPGNA